MQINSSGVGIDQIRLEPIDRDICTEKEIIKNETIDLIDKLAKEKFNLYDIIPNLHAIHGENIFDKQYTEALAERLYSKRDYAKFVTMGGSEQLKTLEQKVFFIETLRKILEKQIQYKCLNLNVLTSIQFISRNRDLFLKQAACDLWEVVFSQDFGRPRIQEIIKETVNLFSTREDHLNIANFVNMDKSTWSKKEWDNVVALFEINFQGQKGAKQLSLGVNAVRYLDLTNPPSEMPEIFKHPMKANRYLQVVLLILNQFKLSERQLSRVLAGFNQKDMKEGKRCLIFVEFLQHLISFKGLNEFEKGIILTAICSKHSEKVDNAKEILKKCKLIIPFLLDQQIDVINGLVIDVIRSGTWNDRLCLEAQRKWLMSWLDLTDETTLNSLYHHSFEVATELLIYIINIEAYVQNFPEHLKIKNQIQKGIKQFISCFNEEDAFHKLRYGQAEEDAHLKICKEALGEKWKLFLTSSSEGYSKGKDIGILTGDQRQQLRCYLLSGSDVVTCHNCSGDINHSRAILGYALNGKSHLVVIWDSITNIVMARAILRLLIDGEKHPIFFMETIYGNINEKDKAALLAQAIKRAKELGIPLIAKRKDTVAAKIKTVDYTGELISLSGWDMEYVDSLRPRIAEKGEYTLSNHPDLVQILTASDHD